MVGQKSSGALRPSSNASTWRNVAKRLPPPAERISQRLISGRSHGPKGKVFATRRTQEPLIDAERAFRGHTTDPKRWQVYFENLVRLVEECPPDQARQKQRNWKL